jgi:hypothetical protein
MKLHVASIGVAFAIVAGLGANGVFAQQAPAKRNFEAEIQAALESAKTAANGNSGDTILIFLDSRHSA